MMSFSSKEMIFLSFRVAIMPYQIQNSSTGSAKSHDCISNSSTDKKK
jgi:hypothetical protein